MGSIDHLIEADLALQLESKQNRKFEVCANSFTQLPIGCDRVGEVYATN